MEAEEDLFVVIVGDDSSVTELPLNIHLESVDQQISDEPVENILKQASEFGEFIDDEFKIQVQYEEAEMLEDGSESQDIDGNEIIEEVEYINHKDISQENTEVNIPYTEGEEIVISNSPKKSKAVYSRSIVAELRETYPELQDEEYLVDTVKELMKTCKPPPLPIHYCKHVVNKDFKCTICDAMSPSLIAAGRHYEENHGPRYLTCYACGVTFRRKENLYKHEQVCKSPDAAIVLKARELQLGWYATGRSLGKMARRKATQSSIACPVCYQQFPDVNKMKIHTKTVHISPSTPYKCSECPATYSRPSVLKTHMKQQHGDDTFICDVCSRPFKTKQNLITHLDSHQSLKKFACTQCPKRYTTRHALNKHVDRLHKNMPPSYVCQFCLKRYYAMWELKLHMKKEHDATLMTEEAYLKNFQITGELAAPNAKVVSKEELERLSNETMEQYLDEKEKKDLEKMSKKRFKCQQCDRGYASKVDLSIHQKAMHEGPTRPMRCQICQRLCSRLDLLKRHMKNNHNMTIMTPESFQKALPNLTKEQIEEAQIVLKPSAIDKDSS